MAPVVQVYPTTGVFHLSNFQFFNLRWIDHTSVSSTFAISSFLLPVCATESTQKLNTKGLRSKAGVKRCSARKHALNV